MSSVYEECLSLPHSPSLTLPLHLPLLLPLPLSLQNHLDHLSILLQNTGPIRSYFIVSPQWLSEKIEAPPTTSRGHRPWPFEFPGARTARRPASAKTPGIPEDEDEYERQKVELTMSSGLPSWSSLSSSPRAWVNPAKYSYQLDSSRFETGGAQQQPSR